MTSGPGPVSPPAAVWRVGDVIEGRYEVLHVHEQGGMGLVYRVRHLTWGTDLALKRPRPDRLRGPRDRERFVTEADLWISLGLHPHVCGCHFVRVVDGVPCVFAEYVPGGSLADRIRDGRLYEGSPDDVLARILRVAVQMAWGLDHAHRRSLVHRDVKPANVLLDLDGTAKLTDFGLAGAHAGTSAGPDPATGAGGAWNTAAYASPEQAGGRTVGWVLGRRSDVYSYGVSVLEMFTGGVTWMAGPAAGAALEEHLADGGAGTAMGTGTGWGGGAGTPPPIPREVAGLLRRCLQRNAILRPRSMGEIADELTALYERSTGRAAPPPPPVTENARADELNNRGLSLLELGREEEAETLFAEALQRDPQHLAATYHRGLMRWRRGDAAPDGPAERHYEAVVVFTDEDLLTELDTLRARTDDPWQARLLIAQVHLERGDLDSARALLDELEDERPADPDVRAARQALLDGRVPGGRCLGTRALPWQQDGTRHTSRLAPNGRWLMSSRGADGTTRLWDLTSRVCRLTVTATPNTVDADVDGQIAVSADAAGTVRVWDLADGRCLRSLPLPEAETERERTAGLVRLSGDARQVTVVVDDEVCVWDVGRAELIRRRRLDGRRDTRWGEVSDDGRWALSSRERGGPARLWNLETGRSRLVLPDYSHAGGTSMAAVCLDADASMAVTATVDRVLRVWDLATGRCVRRFSTNRRVTALSMSADGRSLLTGAADGSVQLWDLHRGRCLRTFRGHRGVVLDVLIGAAGTSGLSFADDGTARWWEWEPLGQPVAAPHFSMARRPAELDRLGEDVDALVARAERARAEQRFTAARDLLARARAVPGHERSPRLLDAWHALGRVLPKTGLRASWPVRTFTAEGMTSVLAVALAADGRRAVSVGGGFDPVRVWDVTTGTVRPRHGAGNPTTIALSPDGERLLTAGHGRVGVWSVDDFVRLTGLDRDQVGGAQHVSFSADGRFALAASHYYPGWLWELDTGRRVQTLRGGGVSVIWLGDDGRMSVSGGLDGLVRLWDLDSGACVRVLSGHPGPVASVCLSADGTRILTSGTRGDPTIRLWDAADGTCLRVFDELPAYASVVRFTADGRFAVSGGGYDAAVRVWDVGTGRCLSVLAGGAARITDVAVTPDGRFVLAGEEGGTLRLWELDWELGALGAPEGETGERWT
ncbi:protein kinase [Streptomyces sp. P9(2023)]|uniref:protein kinase domain-containing protein n=1 Tax=Streptomyces sp. P9(2023) TaxID=3064394 RepID=UPI0028F41BCB|nr:protein kinase [Streptomyces sp. P9(2023)]MDT9687358.1 protein kinase [Streptomyces sp. P9(2023)]